MVTRDYTKYYYNIYYILYIRKQITRQAADLWVCTWGCEEKEISENSNTTKQISETALGEKKKTVNRSKTRDLAAGLERDLLHEDWDHHVWYCPLSSLSLVLARIHPHSIFDSLQLYFALQAYIININDIPPIYTLPIPPPPPLSLYSLYIFIYIKYI